MKNNNFFEFSNNSTANKKFTWAYGIDPKSKKSTKVCRKCGSVSSIYKDPLLLEVEGGSKYPDVLGCGEYPFLIASEMVVTDWEREKVSGFRSFPAVINKVESVSLEKSPIPKYYRIEISGQCRIDLQESGYKNVEICKKCGQTGYVDIFQLTGHKMIPGSWEGTDVFRDTELFPTIYFCTEKVIEVARKYKHTNFRFEPMDEPIDLDSRGIKYLD